MKYKTVYLLIFLLFFFTSGLFSQVGLPDSSKALAADTTVIPLQKNEQAYKAGNGKILVYTKPRHFSFITNLPKDQAGIIKTAFKKQRLKPLLIITGTTLALLLADQAVTNGIRQFSDNIHFHSEEDYKTIVEIKVGNTAVSLIKAPENLNTALYQLGQGFPGLLIGAGLFTYGKIKNDYRALSTASQLAEAFILMGVNTQIIKRITGRQSPANATVNGGRWQPFPAFKNYQANTPNYDAFPSGHIATMMSTITILAENYPKKKYIKPVGYSLIGLVSLSMINNNVHWISDYPLAIGLGYLCAMQVVNRNRKTVETVSSKKAKGELSYTLNYGFGRLMPGVIYKF